MMRNTLRDNKNVCDAYVLLRGTGHYLSGTSSRIERLERMRSVAVVNTGETLKVGMTLTSKSRVAVVDVCNDAARLKAVLFLTSDDAATMSLSALEQTLRMILTMTEAELVMSSFQTSLMCGGMEGEHLNVLLQYAREDAGIECPYVCTPEYEYQWRNTIVRSDGETVILTKDGVDLPMNLKEFVDLVRNDMQASVFPNVDVERVCVN